MGMKTCWSNCLKGNFGQLWPKDLHGYEKCMKKVWKLPTLRCLEKVVLLKLWPPTGMKTLATHGYENKGQFSYSPQGMKTHQSFHTQKKRGNCDLRLKIKGRTAISIHWYSWRSMASKDIQHHPLHQWISMESMNIKGFHGNPWIVYPLGLSPVTFSPSCLESLK